MGSTYSAVVLVVLLLVERKNGFVMMSSPLLSRMRLYSSPGSNANSSSLAAPVPGQLWREQQQSLSSGIIPTGPDGVKQLEQKFGLNREGPPRSASTLRYFQIVEKLAPNEMLQKFAVQAPQNVQEAAKSTVMSILGQLPNYALDASLITTSTKLANLIYQMQMTGYMLKNAEYRMSLTRTLKGLPKLPPATELRQGNVTMSPLRAAEISGLATVNNAQTGEMVQVDVAEITSSLSKEIDALRAELAVIKDNRENELRSNLLTYIQALPERELQRLTTDMSADVMESMNMLVSALMERLGIAGGGPEVVVQQSMGAMAQLCMWQLVVGYKLRELEAVDKGATLE